MNRVVINSFQGGVIKPRLFGRSDTELYGQSIREGMNVIVTPDGGIIKRPGLTKIRDLLSSNVRLEEFIDDDGDTMILELGYDTAGYMKWHKAASAGDKVTASIPWTTAAQIGEMHCVNENGKMYIAHPTNGLNFIQMGASNIEIGSETYYPIVTNDKVYKVDATSIRTDNTGGEFQFYATDIGQYIVMVVDTDIYYALIEAVLETEYDEDVDPQPDYYYSKATIGTVTAVGASAAWSTKAADTVIDYIGIAPFNPYATAFKPGTVCFSGGRMYLSRFSGDKRRIFGSKVGEYTNFRLGPADNFALDYTLTEIYGGEIKWLMGGKELIVGTDTGVLTVTAQGGLGATAIPTIVKQSSIGASYLRPSILGNLYVYPQKTRDGLRVFQYQQQQDMYSTPELTSLCNHLFDSDIKDIAIIENPFPIYFIILENGDAITITYDMTSKVLAGTEHDFNGTLESIAVLKSSSSDNIYAAITNGSTTSLQLMSSLYFEDTIECGVFVETAKVTTGASGDLTSVSAADPGTVTLSDASDFANDDFVRFEDMDTGDTDLDTFLEAGTFKLANKSTNTFDLHDEEGNAVDLSGYSVTFAAGTIRKYYLTVTDLTDYNGLTVEVFADGVSLGTEVVSGGSITMDDYATKIIVGLPYSSYVRLLPLGLYPEGWKRVVRLGVNIYKTAGLHIGGSLATWEEMTLDDEIVNDTAETLMTGVKRIAFTGGYETDNDVYIGTDQAYPMSLLCVYLEVEAEGQ